jgi:hypothetical protein
MFAITVDVVALDPTYSNSIRASFAENVTGGSLCRAEWPQIEAAISDYRRRR